MQRVSGANYLANGNGVGKAAYQDYNPGTGTAGTTPNAAALNALQEELALFIEAQGIALNANDNTQFQQALVHYVTSQLTGYETAAAATSALAAAVATLETPAQVATAIAAALTSFAPLNSPALQGTPTAPTPPSNDNSTRLATTAWVVGQGFETVASATTSFNAVAAALAACLTTTTAAATYLTQTNAAATYAPLSSPALTGTPTAPTPGLGDNSQKLATTAFVLANGFGPNQSWTDYTASRAVNTSYTNTSGRLISVQVAMTTNSAGWYTWTINGLQMWGAGTYGTTNGGTVIFDVPAGATYQVGSSSGTPTIAQWVELRS